MPQQNKITLKTYFNTGDVPTESQFADLVDSSLNLANDDISSLTAATDLTSAQVLIAQGGGLKKAAGSLFITGINTPAAHASTGTVTLTFDQDKVYPDVVQTGPITLAVAGSGNVRGVVVELTIVGDSTNPITLPSTFVLGNGITFDNTKTNDLYIQYKTPTRQIYNVIKSTTSAVDITAPIATFVPSNGATSSSTSNNITISLNEVIYTTTGTLIDNTNVASVVQLKLTNSSGSTVAASITISGTTITIDPTSNLSNSTLYYVALLPVEDVAGNESVLQFATFTTTVAGDVTAPTLTSPTASSTGITTATTGVTTNEVTGTLYTITTISATAPTAAQVKLGQDNGGIAAVYSGNQAITTTGAKTFSVTGLTGSTTYYSYFMHEDASGNQSIVSAASSFTTSTSLLNNIVASWKMEETSGNRLDSSGNNRTLTLNGTLASGTGKLGNAVQFDSNGSNYLSSTSSAINFSASFTVSVWFNRPTTGTKIIWGKWGSGASDVQMYVDGSNLVVNKFVGTVTTIQAAIPTTGQWIHAILKYDGITLSLRVNGGSPVTASVGIGTNSVAAFRVGTNNDNTAANVFDGLVDDLNIWSRTLTTAEEALLYNSGNGLTHPF